MADKLNVSRRGMIEAILSGGLLRFNAADGQPDDDLTLIRAKAQFDRLQALFDHPVAGSGAFWDEFASVCTNIVEARATTMAGLLLKAQTAAWARLGDLEPPTSGQLDARISISLIRDIILLGDPTLYEPGALRRLCPG